MPCALGHPAQPCPYGHTGIVTRVACSACKHFIPPAFILKHCSLYDRDKTLCYLPPSACATCVFKITRGPGRPLGEGKVDWKDRASVNAYLKEWRARNADKAKAIADRFKEKHPNYFKLYYIARKGNKP